MRLCTKSDLCALHTWHSLSNQKPRQFISISTQEPNGICAAPKRAAGMRAALAKDFQKKFGAPFGDLVRFGKAGSAVHQYQQPDDTFHPIQVVQGTCNVARSSMATSRAACLPSAD